ncbi:MAG: hypothetical protein R3213_09815, partial [Flavobacteriaceae bacterium]|nr:hypothetical protein [Flavobacteriaceae bacterium]
MKTRFLSLFLIFSGLILNAQSDGINYKAVISDSNGNPLVNSNVTIQLNIQQGSPLATVYSENHNAVTDASGIVSVVIGYGTPISGTFSDIQWSGNEHALNVKVDIGSGLQDMGTTFFQSVPYALNVNGLQKLDEGNGTGWRLIGKNPEFFGNIGASAIDLSDNDFSSTLDGATGLRAFAAGYSTMASGNYSTAMGYNTDATNHSATAFGNESEASGQNS